MYYVGSTILKLENVGDIDVVSFTDSTYEPIDVIKGKSNYHVLHVSCAQRKHAYKYLYKKSKFMSEQMALYLYQYSNELHPESNVRLFSLLECKEQWKEALFCFVKTLPELTESTIPKKYYNIVYQYYIIQNNSFNLREEQMENVQKIHDSEMPTSFWNSFLAILELEDVS